MAPAPDNDEPFWKNAKYGSRNRVANYLAEELGEGSVFNKDQIREKLRDPSGRGIEQIDRRMRELREVGWVIRTYKDMASLAPNELYLEKIGDRTWEPGYRPPRATTLSANDRRAAYERDGRRCMVCGIDFGDEYPHLLAEGRHVKARPTIGHWIPKERGGTDDVSNLRPECHLCNEQSRNLTGSPVDTELVKRRIRELNREDKRRLAKWMLSGRRSFSHVENLWAEVQQLPTPARDEVRSYLADMLGY